nr:hypothetical protein Iba_scaffold42176CG0010 [Ipomoea batatas]GMD22751.1 hypothetical protein Iba_scaffold42177CG0010 [Ipomoea batatas]
MQLSHEYSVHLHILHIVKISKIEGSNLLLSLKSEIAICRERKKFKQCFQLWRFKNVTQRNP